MFSDGNFHWEVYLKLIFNMVASRNEKVNLEFITIYE
jgi:hypothetical protein